MTTRQSHRFANVDGPPFRDGVMVEDDDAALLTVRNWTEPGPSVTQPARVTVVAADGDIDVETAPLLRHALLQALGRRATVCCDLSGVTFFGAAAANLLFDVHRRATETGQLFILRGAHAMTEHVLAVVDPLHVVTRY